jgi:hypothetical protein
LFANFHGATYIENGREHALRLTEYVSLKKRV